MKPTFFSTPAQFRKWLQKHAATETELWVGLYKKASGKKGVTYQQALDEALCFGWIDGLRKAYNEEASMIRFSPRKQRSIWSAINIRRVGELTELGRMRKPGLDIFNARREGEGYSIAKAPKDLPEDLQKVFKRNKKAWNFHSAQPPGYRKLCAFWISFAKREETRLKRVQILIDAAEQGMRVVNGRPEPPKAKR